MLQEVYERAVADYLEGDETHPSQFNGEPITNFFDLTSWGFVEKLTDGELSQLAVEFVTKDSKIDRNIMRELELYGGEFRALVLKMTHLALLRLARDDGRIGHEEHRRELAYGQSRYGGPLASNIRSA